MRLCLPFEVVLYLYEQARSMTCGSWISSAPTRPTPSPATRSARRTVSLCLLDSLPLIASVRVCPCVSIVVVQCAPPTVQHARERPTAPCAALLTCCTQAAATASAPPAR